MLSSSQLWLHSPPHLQAPTIGPFSSRLLLRGWGEAWAGPALEELWEWLAAGSWAPSFVPSREPVLLGLGAVMMLGPEGAERQFAAVPCTPALALRRVWCACARDPDSCWNLPTDARGWCLYVGEGCFRNVSGLSVHPLSGCQGWHTSLQLVEHETAMKYFQDQMDRCGEVLGSAWVCVVVFSQLLPFAFWKLHFLLC